MNSDQLILRETTNPPLTTKGDYINSSEFDQNLINIYNDLVALCNTSGVIAFDIDTTYDDAINQFATFNGRLYRWINSVEGSGVTPSDEGASEFWLEIFPTDLAHRKNSDTILAEGTVNEVSAAEIKAFIAAGLTSTTDLSISARTATSFTLNSSTGADVTIQQATATEAGLLNAEDKGKLQRLSGNNTGDQTLESLGAEAVSNKALDFAILNNKLYPTVQATETRIGERIDELKGAPPVDLDTLEKMAVAIAGKLDGTSTLEDLANVQTGATDGQYLKWVASSGLWEPTTLSTGLTIGTTPITSGTNDRILYQSGGVVSQSSAFTFDGALLTVGNAAKIKSSGLYPTLTLENVSGHSAQIQMCYNQLYFNTGAGSSVMDAVGLSIGFGGTSASARLDLKGAGALPSDNLQRWMASGGSQIGKVTGDGAFTIGTYTSPNTKLSIVSSGGFGIYTSGSTGIYSECIQAGTIKGYESLARTTTTGGTSYGVKTIADGGGATGLNYGGHFAAHGSGTNYAGYFDAVNGTTNYGIFVQRGKVNLGTLPTSSAGLSTGDIWNDSGTLKVV